jgi:hypothetical protein
MVAHDDHPGHGDVPPRQHAGIRVIAVVVTLVGIGFVAVLTGAIVERFMPPEPRSPKQTTTS